MSPGSRGSTTNIIAFASLRALEDSRDMEVSSKSRPPFKKPGVSSNPI